jgi:hypothetical protein
MTKRSLLVLVGALALPARADHGAEREALEGLKRLSHHVEDTDAPCARKVAKRLDALRDEVREDGRSRRVLSQLEQLREFAEESCPRRQAKYVADGLEDVSEALRGPRSSGRRERSRDDDDDDERPAERTRARRDCGTLDDPGCAGS